MSSIAAATEAVRVCIKKAQMFSIGHLRKGVISGRM